MDRYVPTIEALMLPSAVLTHLNAGVRAEADPLPVFMTCLSLCLIFQAVGWLTPRRRPSSMLEIPCLVWVMWYMARNQICRGNLVAAKIVPAIGEVGRRQVEH